MEDALFRLQRIEHQSRRKPGESEFCEICFCMSIALQFGQRLPRGSLLHLLAFTALCCVLIVATLPNNGPKPRTDLDIPAILEQDLPDETYVQLKVPPGDQPVQSLRIKYRGEHQQIELMQLADIIVGGKTKVLLAMQPPHGDGELGELVKTGQLTGLVSANTMFEEVDMANMKRLFPNLNFANYALLEIVPSDFYTRCFICGLVLASTLFLVIPGVYRILLSRRKDKLWEIETLDSAFEYQPCPTIPAILLETCDFRFTPIKEPKTSRLPVYIQSVLGFIIGFIIAYVVAIAVRNGGPLTLVVGGILAVILLLIIHHKLTILAEALRPLPKRKEIPQHPLTNSSFHQFHRFKLESLGFTSLGLFTTYRRNVVEYFALEQTIFAELGWTISSNPERVQHRCTVSSFLNNSIALSVSVADMAETALESTPPILDKDLLLKTIEKHVANLSEYCDQHNAKVVKVQDPELVSTIHHFEILDKTQQQNQLSDRDKTLIAGLPNWLGKLSSSSSHSQPLHPAQFPRTRRARK